MPTCAIAHCHNGSGRKERPHLDGTKATVHRIPPTEGLLKQWEERINRQNFKVNKDTTVCSLHFDFDAFVDEADNRDKYNRKRKKKTLKPRAIPTLDLRPKKPEIESRRSQGRKTKIANEVAVIPNKHLKLSHLAEHSYVPFVEDTSEVDDTLLPANVGKYDESPKPSTSHESPKPSTSYKNPEPSTSYECPALVMVDNEDLLPTTANQIIDFATIEDCKFFVSFSCFSELLLEMVFIITFFF